MHETFLLLKPHLIRGIRVGERCEETLDNDLGYQGSEVGILGIRANPYSGAH